MVVMCIIRRSLEAKCYNVNLQNTMTALTQNTICKCQDGNQLADSQNFCWKYYVTDYLLQTRLTNFR